MPSALVAALSAPIRDVAAMVGSGWSPGGDPAAVLASVRDDLAGVSEATAAAWGPAGHGWTGPASEAAREFSDATVAAVSEIAARADDLRATTTRAAEAVASARARLQTILDEFEARAAVLESDLDAPGAEQELIAEARRALDEAVAVVEELEAELDGHAAAVTAGPEPAPTWPAAAAPAPTSLGSAGGGPLGSGLGSGVGSGLGSGLGSSIGGGAPSSHGSADFGFDADTGDRPAADPGVFGSGVAITLPDGSTATAPNAVAASAVRYALTQLGVPYHWGGTTPGVSLDCSGLTQWAYHEAGLELPRLAQEQDIGAAVNQGALRPGDLAVWDGHVAMIVGDGQMIEAGDPVKLSPIRTTNAGQGFQGFWRPTA
jgi:cell wall-associated NlpC family hydrolase